MKDKQYTINQYKKFGLHPMEQIVKYNTYIKTRCKCGTEFLSKVYDVKRGFTKSCGHCIDPKIGDKFNSLTVVMIFFNEYRGCKVVCQCDCGNYTKLMMFANIKSGNNKTCGHCNDPEVGDRIGKLVIKEVIPARHKGCKVICDCDCGDTYGPIKYGSLSKSYIHGKTMTCGKCNMPNIGDRYGKLTITGIANSGSGGFRVDLLCDCGTIINRKLGVLTNGNTTSCGFCQAPNVDDKYGKLTVTSVKINHSTHTLKITTKCDCGKEYIPHNWYMISSGNTKSCGHCDDPSVGDKKGKLTIEEKSESDIRGCSIRCRCDCGNLTEWNQGYRFYNSTWQSCGYCNNPNIGDRFGKLIVTDIQINHSTRQLKVTMQCDCGKKYTPCAWYSVSSGKVKSCGHCNDPNIGDRKGKLTVEEKKEIYNGGCSIRCRCDCGKLSVWKKGCYFYNSTWQSCDDCKLYRNGRATSYKALEVHGMIEEITGYLCHHNCNIDGKNFDIVDLNSRTVIEYDEYHWHRRVQDTSKKEKADTKLALRNGFKMLRIQAGNDLPTKDQLKEILTNHFRHDINQYILTTPGWRKAEDAKGQ